MSKKTKVPIITVALCFCALGPFCDSADAATVPSRIQFVDSGQRLGGADNDSLDVALGDVDGDGDLDAMVANFSTGAITRYSQLWLNQGGVQGGVRGTFVDSGQKLGTGFSHAVTLADLDGDGDLDALFIDGTFTGGSIRTWLNQGGIQGGVLGVFQSAEQLLPMSAVPTAVALGALDARPGLDAFVTSVDFGDHADRILFNDGAGQLRDSGQQAGRESDVHVALGDLDGDGDLDAFIVGLARAQVWINQGAAQGGAAGTFLNSGQSLGNTASIGVALGDLDGDGDLDAFIAKQNNVDGKDEVWINQGGRQGGAAGVFLNGSQTLGTIDGRKVALGDLDADGDLDAFVASGIENRIYENDGFAKAKD